VIHGNYDTYEMMRAQQEAAEAPRKKEAAPARPSNNHAAAPAKQKRKRKFPYRKVAEIEADIAAAETQLQELEQLLATPDLYRDGERVKQTTKSFEETKDRLRQLYEHWEEAAELNG
jgi:ATP-binding cassette subfamily F protein 3